MVKRKMKIMKNLKAFNLNCYILVRLKIKGYQLLADQHNELFRKFDKTFQLRDAEYYERQADPNGYTKFQAWDFIEKFGNHTGIGMQQIYATTILISNDDLSDVKLS